MRFAGEVHVIDRLRELLAFRLTFPGEPLRTVVLSIIITLIFRICQHYLYIWGENILVEKDGMLILNLLAYAIILNSYRYVTHSYLDSQFR